MGLQTFPKVSVIVPAFNAAAYLRDCLDSILSQDYPNIEVIVVDDGSTDATAEVAQSYGTRVRYLWQKNSGRAATPRNKGASIASGSYLTFLDADDVMAAGKISRQVDFLEENPIVSMVLTNYRNFNTNGLAAHSHFETCPQLLRATGLKLPDGESIIDPPVSANILITENFSIACSPMLRRAVFTKIGAFDETLKASEDFDLVYRIARREPIGVVADIGFLRRLHRTNQSNRFLHVYSSMLASRTKLFGLETDPTLSKRLREAVGDIHLALAEELVRQRQSGALRNIMSALRYKRRPTLHMAKVFIKTGFAR